jgi:hypothetical protein
VKRRAPLRRRTPIRPDRWARRWRPDKAKNRAYSEVCDEVRRRSRGICEAQIPGVCTRYARHVHHVILRSRGGPDEAWNLLDLCVACHDHVHHFPGWAQQAGFIQSRGGAS